MAKSLVDFLRENPVEEIIDEVVISTRLKDFKFKIKAMSYEEFVNIRNQCADKNGIINNSKFDRMIIMGHCLYPNFKSSEEIKAAGVATPDQYLNKVLLAGEQMELSRQISKLSGMYDDVESLRKEVKN